MKSSRFAQIQSWSKAASLGGLVIFLAFALSACGTKLTDENLAKVKNGMSSQQVKSILGKPTRSDTAKILGLEGTTYYYETGDADVQISFLNDEVTVKLGSFGGKK
jgi:hypothetical protein